MSFTILGTGSALPERILTNEELTHMVDTSDEWIITRTGIRERRIITCETLTQLGAQALQKALENAGCTADELDLILCTTVRGDMTTPALANLIELELGINCRAMDINGACAGFVAALDMAGAYLDSGRVQRVAVVSAEAMSFMCDWTNRATCVLFGDGAGAVVLGPGSDLKAFRMTAQPNDEYLFAGAPKGNSPFLETPKKDFYLNMNGQEVYKFAVSSVSRDIKGILEENSVLPDDVDWYLLHQANMRILDAARMRLKQPREKFPTTIEKYGNVSSATIPILLDEMNRDGRLQKGQKLVLSAFGAGLTTATALITWQA